MHFQAISQGVKFNMPKRFKDCEIEKILNDFDESDISNLEDSEKSDILDDLLGALEKNNYFVIEELSRQSLLNFDKENFDNIDEN